MTSLRDRELLDTAMIAEVTGPSRQRRGTRGCPVKFEEPRNRIGDLLLLPKQFNASYNDDPYEKKLPHYFGQNLLAASLYSLSYEKNPGFLTFTKSSCLPFKAYDEFKAADVVERGNLYRSVAKRVWNPDDLLAVAESDA